MTCTASCYGLECRPRPAQHRGVIALAGLLAGYGGRTRDAYGLRQFFAWRQALPAPFGDAEKATPLAITQA